MPDRLAFESRVRGQITKHIHPSDASKSKILSRVLKICKPFVVLCHYFNGCVGLHNGHTIISNNGEWHCFQLEEDQEDPDVLLTHDDAETINLFGYHAHEYVAVIFMVEYEVGIPADIETEYNARSTIRTAFGEGNMQIAKVLLGSCAYIPFFNGRFSLICNPFFDEDALGERDNDELSIQLLMTTDDLCQILSQSLIFRDESRGEDRIRGVERGDPEDSMTDRNIIEMAFDLKVFGESGEYSHGDSYDPDIREEEIGKRPRGSLERRVRPSSVQEDKIYDDIHSVAELSIVEGDSDVSSLRLDRDFYDNRGTIPRLFAEPNTGIDLQKGSSLLAKSLRARLSNHARQEPAVELESSRDHRKERDHISTSLRESWKQKTPTVAQSHDVVGARQLSRGARSRLGRHGFNEVPYDSMTGKTLIRSEHQIASDYDHRGFLPRQVQSQLQNEEIFDLDSLADDILSINEINLQFAGFKTYFPTSRFGSGEKLASRASLTKDNPYVPRCVYFSYQLYTCEPTRTEVMRLVPNSDGKSHFVLVRDEAESTRRETPLIIRHIVNCDTVSAMEAYDFVKYLTRCTFYVDVWDADSLLYLGTMAVPLRSLLRRGETRSGCTLECDVICSRASGSDSGEVSTTVICDGRAPSGDRVGSVHLIMSNTGHAGKNTKESRAASLKLQMSRAEEGINWRAHSSGKGESTRSKRPKNSVRARPLAENAPNLSRALDDFRSSSDDRRGTMRSLSAVRGTEDVHTVTYDDVILLFKRFQGGVKGTVQYEGALMKLLDIPSWAMAVRKLTKMFKKIKVSGHDMKQVCTLKFNSLLTWNRSS